MSDFNKEEEQLRKVFDASAPSDMPLKHREAMDNAISRVLVEENPGVAKKSLRWFAYAFAALACAGMILLAKYAGSPVNGNGAVEPEPSYQLTMNVAIDADWRPPYSGIDEGKIIAETDFFGALGDLAGEEDFLTLFTGETAEAGLDEEKMELLIAALGG
jgi:hypothetical protein